MERTIKTRITDGSRQSLASGHWLYAFVRSSGETGQSILVIANLHPTESFRNVRVLLSHEALECLRLSEGMKITLRERLSTAPPPIPEQRVEEVVQTGFFIPEIPPFTPYILAIGQSL